MFFFWNGTASSFKLSLLRNKGDFSFFDFSCHRFVTLFHVFKVFLEFEFQKSSYSLFDKHWTAVEELDLLNAIIEYGFGNW